jgi:hypothetical protein
MISQSSVPDAQAVRLSPGSLFPAPEFLDQRPHPRSPSLHTTVEDRIAGQSKVRQSSKSEVPSDELHLVGAVNIDANGCDQRGDGCMPQLLGRC